MTTKQYEKKIIDLQVWLCLIYYTLSKKIPNWSELSEETKIRKVMRALDSKQNQKLLDFKQPHWKSEDSPSAYIIERLRV